MSDKSKFEQMLEKLVADDKAAAEEIFHNIVVEKSRSIYEAVSYTQLTLPTSALV